MSADPNEDGFYYLHTEGTLHWKRFEPEDDSDFVVETWDVNLRDRNSAWIILLEALAMGANVDAVRSLATQWGCDEEDLREYMLSSDPTERRAAGLIIFTKEILGEHPLVILAHSELRLDAESETIELGSATPTHGTN